jgi:hypothetical protein
MMDLRRGKRFSMTIEAAGLPGPPLPSGNPPMPPDPDLPVPVEEPPEPLMPPRPKDDPPPQKV